MTLIFFCYVSLSYGVGVNLQFFSARGKLFLAFVYTLVYNTVTYERLNITTMLKNTMILLRIEETLKSKFYALCKGENTTASKKIRDFIEKETKGVKK